jgi:hypothetical protein
MHRAWLSGLGLINANYIIFSASGTTNPMQRMVNILDTMQQLLYFPNARNSTSSVRAIPVRDSKAVRFIETGHENALLRQSSADKTAGEKYSSYLVECYED